MSNSVIKAAGLPSSGSSVIPMDGKFYPVGHIKEGSLVRADSEAVIAPWWEPDAIVAVDAANTSVGNGQNGTGVLQDHVGTLNSVSNMDIVDTESRSTPNAIRINASSTVIRPNRIGATVPWTNEGNDWTIEYVFKHISGYGGLDINNYTTLSNRIQCAGGEASNAVGLQIYNNTTSPRFVGTTYGVNDGDWHHVAVTFEVAENRWRFYLDGVYRYSTVWAPLLSTLNEGISRHAGSCYLDRYQMVPRLKYTGNFAPSL